MNKKMKKTAIALATLMVASESMAATIFSDDFSDGNRDGWYLLNDGGQNSLVAETLGGGETVMTFSDGDSTTADWYGGVTSFSAQDLSLDGATITLSFDYTNASNWPSGRGWTVGLFNSNGTSVTADTTAAGAGWGASADDSGILGAAQRYTDRFTIRETVSQGIHGNTGGDLTTRTDNKDYGVAGTWFSYSLEIENIAGDLQYTATFSGAPVVGTRSQVYLDETVNNYSFDQIGFSARDNVGSSFDNVMVSYVVLEPSSAALLGLGGLALVLRRRK